MSDLASVVYALDMFPDWDENMRAEVYHAIDLAPVYPPSTFAEAKEYFSGEGHAAWMRIRTYVLAPGDNPYWPIILDEAAGFESAPTKSELVKALHRGARMIR